MVKQNMPDIGVQIYMNDQHTTIMHYIGCLVYGYMGIATVQTICKNIDPSLKTFLVHSRKLYVLYWNIEQYSKLKGDGIRKTTQ